MNTRVLPPGCRRCVGADAEFVSSSTQRKEVAWFRGMRGAECSSPGSAPTPPHGVSTMRRLADRPVTAVAATRPRVARPILLITLFALATALAALVFARSTAPRHAASDADRPVQVVSVDRAAQPWFLP